MEMKHNPNAWSCTPTAFAMVIGCSVKYFIEKIGHDGSAQPFADKSYHVGYHPQECIDVAYGMGYSCTPIELMPQSLLSKTASLPPHVILFGKNTEANNERFLRYLKRCDGVLCGTMTDTMTGHAVAWEHETGSIFDPRNGRIISPEAQAAFRFFPSTFWMLEKRS